MTAGPIVVGTAGAESGSPAVAWAAREALLRGRALRIVHVIEWNRDEAREANGSTYVERVWSLSAAITDAAVRHARDSAPGLDITVDTLVGDPAGRLLEAARDAELLVVGYRGRGGFAGLRLGSVGRRVAMHAAAPVVVVRGRAHPDGPVVAGLDEGDQVVEAAFAAAAARGAGLVLVRPATHPDDRLTPWRAKFPEVPVEVRDGGAATLMAASADAQLMVVGAGHRVPVWGHDLLQNARCPVLVTRWSSRLAAAQWTG